ncbi:uncharacterized protein LOC34622324 [Cyclospora cayetanensis]|uniref:Uncharacterized protein LOC34622324 n=1 Tax=Cyclospora cayetanensis TaxID=88456 RepID=A0A6P6RVF0_9EIME|nr:uncharacterized protein LOC34622324 [Cyclospora cayetanensis]
MSRKHSTPEGFFQMLGNCCSGQRALAAGAARGWGPPAGPPPGLREGLQVEAQCVRVWCRYALLRLLPPPPLRHFKASSAARQSRDVLGFLHVSGVRRGRKALGTTELKTIDLTQILSVGASYKVDLLGAPSAATSHRWQLSLALPSADEGAPPRKNRQDGSFTRDSKGPLYEAPDFQEALLAGDASPEEAWSSYDCSLVLDAEEDALAKASSAAHKGLLGGRRKRGPPKALRGGTDPNKRQGTRGGGREGRRLLGGRHSTREREDEADEGAEAFFVGEVPEEEDSLLEEGGAVLVASESKPTANAQPIAQIPPETASTIAPQDTLTNGVAGRPRERVSSSSSRRARKTTPLVQLQPRPAIVAVLGHVDHGKTTLLRALRLMGPQKGPPTPRGPRHCRGAGPCAEAGGITQQIGFFEVVFPESVVASVPRVTFLDTPGHGAFSLMRLRAARAADVVLLVIAANEGVQEETRQCLKALEELKLPTVVVLTKTDIAGDSSRSAASRGTPLAGPEFLSTPEGARLLGELAADGLLTEPLGGLLQVAAVNAKGFLDAREEVPPEGAPGDDPYGMKHLLECVALQAEVLGLRSNAHGGGKGLVLEAHCSAAQGGSASVILKEGSLKVGDWLAAGPSICRVRRLRRVQGPARISAEASSTQPPESALSRVFEVFGFPADALPCPGEEAFVLPSEDAAKQHRDEAVLPVTVRAAAQGSAAAVAAALEGLTARRNAAGIWQLCTPEGTFVGAGGSECESPADDTQGQANTSSGGDVGVKTEAAFRRVRVLRAVAGECHVQDVHSCMDEQKRGGLLIAFGTKISREAKRAAEMHHVQLVPCDIIYKAVEAVEQRLLGPSLFPLPSKGAATQGASADRSSQATVKQLFALSNGSVVAGCDLLKGKLRRGDFVWILRGGTQCHTEAVRVVSLRVGKDAKESVTAPVECGVLCEGFKDWQVGDTLIRQDDPGQRVPP